MPCRIIQEIEDVLKAGYLLVDDNEMLAAAAAPPSDRTHATAVIGCVYLQGPHIYTSVYLQFYKVHISAVSIIHSTYLRGSNI